MQKLYLPDHQANEAATSVILTDNGRQRYLLTGKNGLRSNHLEVQNLQGTVLAAAHQLGWGLRSKYQLINNQQPVGTITKPFGIMPEVRYVSGLNWVIIGNALNNHYRVFRTGRLVFMMQPMILSDTTYYELAITNEADEPLAILIATLVNRWQRKYRRLPGKLYKPSLNGPALGYSYQLKTGANGTSCISSESGLLLFNSVLIPVQFGDLVPAS